MPRKISHPFGVTQQDIADSLCISRSTVAQALNPKHEGKLQRETVEKVKRRALEMNYYPKRFAQVLREGKAYTIGAVFKLARYYAPHEQIRLLSHTVLNRGYHLVTIDRSWFEGKPKAEEKFILESALDGLIFYNLKAERLPRWMDILQERGFPMVSIGCDFPHETDSISCDFRDGFRQLTRHHLEMGSRSLGLLLYSPVSFIRKENGVLFMRVEGFMDEICRAGGEVSAPSPLPQAERPQAAAHGGIHGRIICCEDGQMDDNVYRFGFRITRRLIESGTLPDSLLCSNDEMAAGALTACLQMGVAVPGRVRISGADDEPFSGYCGVPITTISQPMQKISDRAADHLIGRIEQGRSAAIQPLQSLLFEPRLVVRTSTSGVPV